MHALLWLYMSRSFVLLGGSANSPRRFHRTGSSVPSGAWFTAATLDSLTVR